MRIFSWQREHHLLERIRQDDPTVLTELYLKYERLVTDQIIRLGGDHAAAEDMLQEAIITIWENVRIDRFRFEAKLGTYIAAVARKTYMNQMRKRKGKELPLSEDDFPTDNTSMLEVIIDQERMDLIATAMEGLQDICRRILVLFYYEQRSLAYIARELNFANVQVAKSKKYQCKKALKEILLRRKIIPEGKR